MRHLQVTYSEEIASHLYGKTEILAFEEYGVYAHFCVGFSKGILIDKCLSAYVHFDVVDTAIAGGLLVVLKKASEWIPDNVITLDAKSKSNGDPAALLKMAKEVRGKYLLRSTVVPDRIPYVRLETFACDIAAVMYLRDEKESDGSDAIMKHLFTCHLFVSAELTRCLSPFICDTVLRLLMKEMMTEKNTVAKKEIYLHIQ